MKVTIRGFKSVMDEKPAAVETYEGDRETVDAAVAEFAKQYGGYEIDIDEPDVTSPV
jgi:hypothetical protein